MSAHRWVQQVRAGIVRRHAWILALALLPWGLSVAAVGMRWGGVWASICVALLFLAGLWDWQRRAATRQTTTLVRRLDAAVPALEDSTALLLEAPQPGLAGLQQQRIGARLAGLRLPELRPSWPTRGLLLNAPLALLLAAALCWVHVTPLPPANPPVTMAAPAPAPRLTLTTLQVDIQPPAYTDLPARSVSDVELQAPEGSRLRLRLRTDPSAQQLSAQIVGGPALPLQADADGDWTLDWTLERSVLLRLVAEPAWDTPPPRLRWTATPDQPPVVEVLEPNQHQNLATPEQPTWPLLARARDDHGLGTMTLVLVRTQGSGEQIQSSEQRLALQGSGSSSERRYRHPVDLRALGFAEGDDLIARFEVSDRRQPTPHIATSGSVMLRWPAPAVGEASGVDGLVQRTLPAYFRSQRQIIIDTEALIAERPQLGADTLLARADQIGVDQRLLRLRYGQFLGEEFEPVAAPPTHPPVAADPHAGHDHSDPTHQHADPAGHGAAAEPFAFAPRLPTAPKAPTTAAEAPPATTAPQAHAHDHGHDHASDSAAGTAAAGFGAAGDVVAEYGHIHDIPEAATLLDPATRKLLKAALDAMWLAEGQLRLGQPEAALPHEYVALDYIKQVQQASRIYLARVGLELPPIDLSRRLTGDRAGLAPRPLPPAAAHPTDDPTAAAWTALDAVDSGADPAALMPALSALLQAPWPTLDPAVLLDLQAAVDGVQQDLRCTECRARLRTLLWPLLRPATPGLAPSPAATAAGEAYQRALQAESAP